MPWRSFRNPSFFSVFPQKAKLGRFYQEPLTARIKEELEPCFPWFQTIKCWKLSPKCLFGWFFFFPVATTVDRYFASKDWFVWKNLVADDSVKLIYFCFVHDCFPVKQSSWIITQGERLMWNDKCLCWIAAFVILIEGNISSRCQATVSV